MALKLSFNNSEAGCENTVHNQPVLYSKRRLSVSSSSSSSEASGSAEEDQPSEIVNEQPKQIEKKKSRLKSKSLKKPNPLADKELLPVYEDFMSHHQPEPQLESAVEKIIQSYFKKSAAKRSAKAIVPSESEEDEEEEEAEIEPPKAKKPKASTSKPKVNSKSKVKESPDLKLLKQLSKSIESLQQKLNKALDKTK